MTGHRPPAARAAGGAPAGGDQASAAALARRGARALRALAERFGELDLLTYASAVAFQVQFALIPLGLAGVAMLSFLGFGEVWSEQIAPEARDALPGDAFSVLERTVDHVLESRRGFWLTAGIAFALWQLSGALRAASGALNVIYEFEEERSLVRRLATSVALAVAVTPCLLGATVAIGAGGRLTGLLDLSGAAIAAATVARYLLGIALLLLALWLVLRHAPARRRPGRWVSLGSGITIVAWLLASTGYGLYVTHVASYSSIFGAVATVIVFMTYLYIVCVVFLAGAAVDALSRERLQDDPA